MISSGESGVKAINPPKFGCRMVAAQAHSKKIADRAQRRPRKFGLRCLEPWVVTRMSFRVNLRGCAGYPHRPLSLSQIDAVHVPDGRLCQ